MTLLLTHVSNLGVVMAADSAITWKDENGKILNIDQKGWQKLYQVRPFHAGVSYWGFIGGIRRRFDETIRYFLQKEEKYQDLRSLADYLANEMNNAMRGQILESPTGVHVAGYEEWEDGVRRPAFYHIHNGHGHYVTSSQNGILKYNWNNEEPYKLFTVHRDFPSEDTNNQAREILQLLNGGYLTRNGAFYIFSQFFDAQVKAIGSLNSVEGISIPARRNNLSSLKAMWYYLLQNNINIYKASNQHRVVGGKVSSIAFNDERYF